MSASITIRQALKADLCALAQLERTTFGEMVYPAFFFRQALDLWPDYFWLALQEGTVVGYILAAPHLQNRQRICILSIAVLPHKRGSGFGQALLQQLIQACAGGNKQLWLTVAPDNHGAIQLYQKHGFSQQHIEADYFGDHEPRLIMQRQV